MIMYLPSTCDIFLTDKCLIGSKSEIFFTVYVDFLKNPENANNMQAYNVATTGSSVLAITSANLLSIANVIGCLRFGGVPYMRSRALTVL